MKVIFVWTPFFGVAFSVCLQSLIAAPIWEVPAERVEVSSPAHQYRVAVVTDEDKHHMLKSVTVSWNGKLLTVPESELAGISKVQIYSLKVITDRPMRIPGIPILNYRYLTVCLDYGDPVKRPSQKEITRTAFSRVFFEFTGSGIFARVRHVPIADTNRWKTFGKDLGKPEAEDEEIEDSRIRNDSMDSPFGWHLSEFEKSDVAP